MTFISDIKSKYINPYTDFGFKRLFGVEGNKDLLIDFLNQLLPLREQAGKGEWNFQLSPIYYVALLDFEYDERDEKNKKMPKFRRDVMLIDQDGEVFYDKLRFTFLQMPAYDKAETDLKTHYDKWCYFLKHLTEFNDIPSILNEPIFQKAFKTAEIANFSPEEYKKYIDSLDAYREIKGVTENAIEEGKKFRDIEIAINGINEGLSNELIHKLTNLSIEIIQKLRDDLNSK